MEVGAVVANSRAAAPKVGISVGQDVQHFRIMGKLPAQQAQEVLQGLLLLQHGGTAYSVEGDSLLQFFVGDVRHCPREDGQRLGASTALRQCRGVFGDAGSGALPGACAWDRAHDANRRRGPFENLRIFGPGVKASGTYVRKKKQGANAVERLPLSLSGHLIVELKRELDVSSGL